MLEYKLLKIGEKEQKTINNIFHFLGGFPIDIFKHNDWKSIYIESKPFIDEDSFQHFQSVFFELGEKKLNIFNYPLHRGESYLKFEKIPDFQFFSHLMDTFYYSSTGGVAYGSSLEWAIHSDADNSVLFFGYQERFDDKVKKIFSANRFIISKSELLEIYNKNKGIK